MANVSTALRALLLTKTAITNLVVDRIWVNCFEQATALPAISIELVSTQRRQSISGTRKLTQARYQVDCYATSPDAASELALACQFCGLETYRGTTEGIFFNGMAFDSDYQQGDEPIDGSADRRFIHSFDLTVDYTEA